MEKIMPKMKSRSSAAKRFDVTGSGKFRRRRQNLRHILTKKNAKRKMRLGQSAIADSSNARAIRRMLPYA
jgi:large subunit ribosomal protein L35